MAYVSGIANTFADLATAVRNACVANGWSLAGDVVHKGPVYARVWVDTWANVLAELGGGSGTSYATTMEGLHVRVGLGVDGSNALTDPMPNSCGRIGRITRNSSAAGASAVPFTFPVNYFIFINTDPDEVYVVVNHDVDRYQHAAFGFSPLAAATGGAGVWGGAALAPIPNRNNSGADGTEGIFAAAAFTGTGGSGISWMTHSLTPPFVASPDDNGSTSSIIGFANTTGTFYVHHVSYRVHHGVDLPGGGWSGVPNAKVVAVNHFPLLLRTPNALNGGAPLLPIQGLVLRASSKQSAVLELAHARLLRIDHVAPEAIVSYGSEDWKVFPWHRKDLTLVLGSSNLITHSGGLGFAVRYTP